MKIWGGIVLLTLRTAAVSSQDLDSLMAALDAGGKPEPVRYCFKTTRLANLQTTEQLKGRELDFSVAHRFDDIGGRNGGYSTLRPG